MWEFDKIQPKWHPMFDISSIPDVEMSPLPFAKKIGYLQKWKELNKISPPKPSPSEIDSKPDVEHEVKVIPEAPAKVDSAPKKPLSRAAALLERVPQA